MADTIQVRVRAPIALTVLEMIRTRFDHVSMPGPDRTVLIVERVDHASARALLTLLWDTGNDVLTFDEVPHDD